MFGLLDISHFQTFHQAERIPNFVVEISSLLTQCIVVEDIVACRGCEHQTHAHAIGTIFFNQFNRVGRVAKALAHFAAQLVAHNAGEIHVTERHIAHVFISGHNHACHPEEDDVGSGHQVGGGVVVANFLVVGVVNTVEQRNRPQPA